MHSVGAYARARRGEQRVAAGAVGDDEHLRVQVADRARRAAPTSPTRRRRSRRSAAARGTSRRARARRRRRRRGRGGAARCDRDRRARRDRAVVVRLGAVDEQRIAGRREVEHDDAVARRRRSARGSAPTRRAPSSHHARIAGRLGEIEERARAERVVVERAVEVLGLAVVEHAARSRVARRPCDRARTSPTRSASASAGACRSRATRRRAR